MAPSKVSAAEYFEQSAKPAHAPVANHQPQAARPSERNAATKQVKAPSRAAKSGPSGTTQVPPVTPRTGAKFSTTVAHQPASGSKSTEVIRYISHVVSAKSATNGSRTTNALSLPVRCAPHAIHQASGGWSK